MRKVKIGNEFPYLMKIERAGVAVDLHQVQNPRLTRYVGRIGNVAKDIPFDILNDGLLRVNVTRAIADRLGNYILEFSYDSLDATFPEGTRESCTDTEAFTIVLTSAEADADGDISSVADMLIGLRGKPFESKDFTAEEWDSLKFKLEHFSETDIASFKQPAVDAANIVYETVIPAAEQATSNANEARNTIIETVIPAAESATSDAIAAAKSINEVVIPAAEQATQAAIGVVNNINSVVLPAMNAAKQGAIDATQSALDAASNANEQALRAEEAAIVVESFVPTQVASAVEYELITF